MYKILLVDDEILVREAIRDKMKWEMLGFELVGDCENGKDAIAFLQNQAVDVVLTDIYMPYVDGLGLSKHIHEHYPETSIIIFSGYNDFEYAQRALRYNVAEYILKPVTAKELSLVLQKMKEKLDSKRQEKEQLNELTKAHQSYVKNETYIVAKILSNLIKGSVDVAASLRGLSELGIEIRGKAHRVAIVEIDDRESSLFLDEEKRKRLRSSLSYAICNIAGEILEKNELGIAFLDADGLVNLLFFTDEIVDFSERVTDVCRQIQVEVSHASKEVYLSIAIGIYANVLEELHKSYESALDALSYGQSKNENVILDMEKVVRSTKERQTLLAIEYLHKNYGNSELTLKDVCEHLGISTSHFSSLFKEETGMTFLKYLNNIRMEKAKQLLRETDLKNYEIAERVGFRDPHYFSIAFKKKTGKTPGKYGKEHLKDE